MLVLPYLLINVAKGLVKHEYKLELMQKRKCESLPLQGTILWHGYALARRGIGTQVPVRRKGRSRLGAGNWKVVHNCLWLLKKSMNSAPRLLFRTPVCAQNLGKPKRLFPEMKQQNKLVADTRML